jgi:isopropylmalate/homocitrate/citramalate synthase
VVEGVYLYISHCADVIPSIFAFLPSQLVNCGFKEIEIAYPAASETDFSFVRMIVDKKMGVDQDVWIQVCYFPSLISHAHAEASSRKRPDLTLILKLRHK